MNYHKLLNTLLSNTNIQIFREKITQAVHLFQYIQFLSVASEAKTDCNNETIHTGKHSNTQNLRIVVIKIVN